MAGRSQQTHAKRARELAVKERRERKRAKKALRAAGGDAPAGEGGVSPQGGEGQVETDTSEWIQ
jgi:hypothetical protein